MRVVRLNEMYTFTSQTIIIYIMFGSLLSSLFTLVYIIITTTHRCFRLCQLHLLNVHHISGSFVSLRWLKLCSMPWFPADSTHLMFGYIGVMELWTRLWNSRYYQREKCAVKTASRHHQQPKHWFKALCIQAFLPEYIIPVGNLWNAHNNFKCA